MPSVPRTGDSAPPLAADGKVVTNALPDRLRLIHDLNNQLVAIRGYGELSLLKLDSGSEDEVSHCLEQVLAAATTAFALTHELLAESSDGR